MDIQEAKKCSECKGNGEVATMESVYGGSDSHIQAPVGSERCWNCNGTGEEPYEEIVAERIIEGLTPEQERKLQDEHGKTYAGTDDDMPEAFEKWLTGRTLQDLEKILYAKVA